METCRCGSLHSMGPHWNRPLMVLALLSSGCHRAAGEPVADAGAAEGAYVSPAGDDHSPGTIDQPYRTIARALEAGGAAEIRVLPGLYDEPPIEVRRAVALVAAGPSTSPPPAISGRVRVAADHVRLSGLALENGVTLARAHAARLDALHVFPGTSSDAIALTGGDATLTDLAADCGPEACLDVTTATVVVRGAVLAGGGAAKRAFRATTASAALSQVTATGTALDQVLAVGGFLTIDTSSLSGAGGVALAATAGARLRASGVTIAGAAGTGLLIAGATAAVRASTISAPLGTAVGVAGGDLGIDASTLGPAAQGALAVTGAGERPSAVRLGADRIRHGAAPGILLEGGTLAADACRFEGDGAASADGGDAIAAVGVGTVLQLRGSVISSPAGFGVTFSGGAAGTVTATIARPRLGGVLISGASTASVTVAGGAVAGCATGSGVVVETGARAVITGLRAVACPEAGILAGTGAAARVSGAQLFRNAQFGVAAFSGAHVEVASSSISGSLRALYAECTTGAVIVERAPSTISGAVLLCP